MSTDLVVRFAGEGGQGVVTAAEGLAQAAARVGYHVQTFSTFPSQIKGGPTWAQTRISTSPVLASGDELDILVVLNRYAYNHNLEECRDDGIVVYNSGDFEIDDGSRCVGMEVDRLARETGNPLAANMVMIGAVAALARMPAEYFTDFIRERFTRGRANDDAIIEANIKALDLGMSAVDSSGLTVAGLDPPPATEGTRVLMRGYGGREPRRDRQRPRRLRRLPDLARRPRCSPSWSATSPVPAATSGSQAPRSSRSPPSSGRASPEARDDVDGRSRALADERGPRPRLDGRDPARRRQRTARRSLDGPPDQDRAVGPPHHAQPGTRRPPHPDHRPGKRRGVFLRGVPRDQLGGALPGAGHPALRGVGRGEATGRAAAGARLDPAGGSRHSERIGRDGRRRAAPPLPGRAAHAFPVPGGPGAYVANGSEHDEYGDTTHLRSGISR